MIIGYAFIPIDGTSENAAVKALSEFDVEKSFVDGATRKWLHSDLFAGHAVRKGDTLVLLSAEGLVDPDIDVDGEAKSFRRMKGAFRSVLKPIAALGVKVAVRDGPKVLYDTDEAIDGFIDIAVSERHRRLSSDGGRGEKRKKGRPIKYYATDEQKKAICLMWWDKEIERDTVRRNATEMVGWNVTDNVIKSWCGVKREKPDG